MSKYEKFKGIEVGMYGKFWSYGSVCVGILEKIYGGEDFSFKREGDIEVYKHFKPIDENKVKLETFADKCRAILPKTIKCIAKDDSGVLFAYTTNPKMGLFRWDDTEDHYLVFNDLKIIFPELPDFPKGIEWKESKVRIHN